MNKEKFLSNILPEPNSGCWIWMGSTFRPYRRGRAYGRYGKHSRLAHRISWAIHRGDPGTKLVCHTCDNILCVNPDHLFLGTSKDNSDDKVRKGRHSRGADIRPTKVTPEKARVIKSSTLTIAELSRQLDIPYAVIWNIRHGHTWKWA